MPTIKPRVQVTLEPSTHEVIKRLAELQGRSRGSIIAELLDEVGPALTRTVALLEAAAAAPEQVRSGLRSVVEDIHDELLEVSGDSIQQMDWLMSELTGGGASREGQAAHPRAPAFTHSEQVPGGANPHVVTRGSGSGEHRRSSTHKSSQNPSSSGVTGKTPNSKSGGPGNAHTGG